MTGRAYFNCFSEGVFIQFLVAYSETVIVILAQRAVDSIVYQTPPAALFHSAAENSL